MLVGYMEVPESDEDSCSLYKGVVDRMSVNTVEVDSITLDNTDIIKEIVKIGDKVEHGDIILSSTSNASGSMGKFDSKALSILEGISGNTHKASHHGKITKIQMFYNCKIEELSESLKEVADISNKILKKENSKYHGEVDRTYSIKGKPLLEGKVEIKIYTEVTSNGIEVGDKVVIGNQLKATVGEIFTEPIYTESGDMIECIFSTRSEKARIVNSPDLIGTTSLLIEELGKQMSDIYFGGN
jgi:hypothetical protein